MYGLSLVMYGLSLAKYGFGLVMYDADKTYSQGRQAFGSETAQLAMYGFDKKG